MKEPHASHAPTAPPSYPGGSDLLIDLHPAEPATGVEASQMAAPPSVPEVDGGHDEGQRQHDSLVDCLVLEDVPLVLAGIPMEHMSLTTLTWLRRVNSLFATGTKPEDETSLMREVGLFILAHRKDVPLKTRSKLFHLGEALDDAVEEVLHSIPLRKAKVLFDQILHYVTAETSTLATPDRKEGAEQEGNG